MLNNPFMKLDALSHANRELERARVSLLEAQSGLEYAKAMVDYNKSRVERLELYCSKKTFKEVTVFPVLSEVITN